MAHFYSRRILILEYIWEFAPSPFFRLSKTPANEDILRRPKEFGRVHLRTYLLATAVAPRQD